MTNGGAGDSSAARRPALEQAWLEAGASRWLHGGPAEPNPVLLAGGWERRFVTDGMRSKEVIDLYRQLGFEVRLEPILPTEVPDGCTDCQLVVLFQFKTVYTRRPPSIRGGS